MSNTVENWVESVLGRLDGNQLKSMNVNLLREQRAPAELLADDRERDLREHLLRLCIGNETLFRQLLSESIPAMILDGSEGKNLTDCGVVFQKTPSGFSVIAGTDIGIGSAYQFNEDRIVICPGSDVYVALDGHGDPYNRADKRGYRVSQLCAEAIKTNSQDIRAAFTKAQQSMKLEGLAGNATCIAIARINHANGKRILQPGRCGDCRIFVIRNDTVVYETKDQTLTQALVDTGKISPDQATYHDKRNIVSGFISQDDNDFEWLQEFELQPEDIVVGASDGIIDNITPAEMALKIKGMSLIDAYQKVATITDECMRNRDDIIDETDDRAGAGVFSHGLKSRPKCDNRALFMILIPPETTTEKADRSKA